MNGRGKTLISVALVFIFASVVFAQPPQPRPGRGGFSPPGGWGGWGGGNEDDAGPLVRIEGGRVVDENSVRTAREIDSHSTGTPMWTNPRGFEKDVFTLARVIFKVGVGR